MPMTRDDFLARVHNRAALFADPELPGIGHGGAADPEGADHLIAVAEAFADQVDRTNIERTYFPLDYPEAVVIEGHGGIHVVHRDTYARDARACEAMVFPVDAVWSGVTLLGWN